MEQSRGRGEAILCTGPGSEGRQEGEVLQVEEESKMLAGVARRSVEPEPLLSEGGSLSVRWHLVVGAGP